MKKEKAQIGKWLILVGIIIKTAQIISVAAGVKEMGNTVWTAITASFLAGGLLVLCVEAKKKTGIFAAGAAVGVLMSLINTEIRLLLYIPMFATFIFFALLLITAKKRARIYGWAVLLLTAVLLLCSFRVISVSALPGTILLVAIYAFSGIGITLI